MRGEGPKLGRRHHVVQAAYLRHFTSRPGMIWRYDHTHRHWSEVSIKSQAGVVEDFYSPQVENWLASEIESPAIKVLRLLAQGDRPIALNEDQAKSVAIYLAVQHNRTPAALEKWWAPAASLALEKHKDGIGKNETVDIVARLSREIQNDPERAGCSLLTDLGGTLLAGAVRRQADDLLRSFWVVCVTPDDVDLVTTDDPVIGGRDTNVKWAAFPLTTRRYLICFGVEGEDRFTEIVPIENVPKAPAKYFNSQLVSAARRYVYSCKREWWVEGVFTKEPLSWWGPHPRLAGR